LPSPTATAESIIKGLPPTMRRDLAALSGQLTEALRGLDLSRRPMLVTLHAASIKLTTLLTVGGTHDRTENTVAS